MPSSFKKSPSSRVPSNSKEKRQGDKSRLIDLTKRLDVFSLSSRKRTLPPPPPLPNQKPIEVDYAVTDILKTCQSRLAELSQTREVLSIIHLMKEMHPVLEKPLDSKYLQRVEKWLNQSETSYEGIGNNLRSSGSVAQQEAQTSLRYADRIFYEARDVLTQTEQEFDRSNETLPFVLGYNGAAVLKIIESAREGGFGVILFGLHYGAEKRLPDKAIVMKQLLTRNGLSKQKLRERFVRELRIWNEFDHKNIVPCLGAFGDLHVLEPDYVPKANKDKKDELYLVSEFSPLLKVNQETSNKYVAVHPKSLPIIIDGIIEGLVYMHSKGALHGDLKGNNIIMFEKNGVLCPKITDFGLSAIIGVENLQATQKGGAERWRAPEFLQPGAKEDLNLEVSSDVWSFAIMVEELILCALWQEKNAPPFFDIPSTHDDAAFLNFMRFKDNDSSHIDSKMIDYLLLFPTCLQDMISMCLSAQKDQRPSSEDLQKMWKTASPKFSDEWSAFTNNLPFQLDHNDMEYSSYFTQVDEWRAKHNKGSSSFRISAAAVPNQ